MLASSAAFAQEPRTKTGEGYSGASEVALSDLTLGNFFTEGWTQPWAKRERASGTPDMALLKVTTNFLERELRLDYAHTADVKHSRFQSTDLMQGLIAYGLDRRIMVEVITNYQWNTPRTGAGVSGAGGGGLVRFALIDTEQNSIAVQTKVSEPNRSIGQTQTSIQNGLAGFTDMYPLIGLSRVGLYYSLVYEYLYGNHTKGLRSNDIAYDISMAKTWTPLSTPIFGNFTTFLEAFATTDLNGTTVGHTATTLTPGMRFWFYPENSLTFGVDVPVTHPYPFGNVFRATYILNF
ncbi:MAG TPA: hypothetical protein VGU20_16240 [Stellaceae bacterium]|nr:hypothetical protein [Stellaceae bacterium]